MARARNCSICAPLHLRPEALCCCIVCGLVLCGFPLVSVCLQDKASACSDLEFPCVGACTQDFAQPCPAGWELDASGSCVAPASYSGQCPASKSFVNLGLRFVLVLVRVRLARRFSASCCLQGSLTGAPGRRSVKCRCAQ